MVAQLMLLLQHSTSMVCIMVRMLRGEYYAIQVLATI